VKKKSTVAQRNVPVSSLLTPEADDKLRSIAEQEYRTVSATIAVLLSEAMERREDVR